MKRRNWSKAASRRASVALKARARCPNSSWGFSTGRRSFNLSAEILSAVRAMASIGASALRASANPLNPARTRASGNASSKTETNSSISRQSPSSLWATRRNTRRLSTAEMLVATRTRPPLTSRSVEGERSIVPSAPDRGGPPNASPCKVGLRYRRVPLDDQTSTSRCLLGSSSS